MAKEVSGNRWMHSIALGKRTEEDFKEVMESLGHECLPSTRNQNIYDHIDFFVDGYGVDVKGNRHIDCIWLEIDNVRGKEGWLRGKAKYIAFYVEEKESFCLFLTKELLTFVKENVTEETTNKKEHLKFYGRKKWGKLDKLVNVRWSDIGHLCKKEIYKPKTQLE